MTTHLLIQNPILLSNWGCFEKYRSLHLYKWTLPILKILFPSFYTRSLISHLTIFHYPRMNNKCLFKAFKSTKHPHPQSMIFRPHDRKGSKRNFIPRLVIHSTDKCCGLMIFHACLNPKISGKKNYSRPYRTWKSKLGNIERYPRSLYIDCSSISPIRLTYPVQRRLKR